MFISSEHLLYVDHTLDELNKKFKELDKRIGQEGTPWDFFLSSSPHSLAEEIKFLQDDIRNLMIYLKIERFSVSQKEGFKLSPQRKAQ